MGNVIAVVLGAREKERTFAESFWGAYTLTVGSAWMAEMITYPFDLIKTRLQLQGEFVNKVDLKMFKEPYRGTYDTFKGVIKEEGFFSLYKGMQWQLARHFLYSGPRMAGYDYLKLWVFPPNEAYMTTFMSNSISGMTAGFAASFLGNPADVAKVYAQMEGKRELLHMRSRTSVLLGAFRTLYATSGPMGFWKGCFPNAFRASLINLGDLACYDLSKDYILELKIRDGLPTHIASSAFSGLITSLLSTPLDTLKTRMMNQPVDKRGRGKVYRSTWNCLRKTWRFEGIKGVYKGFVPNCMRNSPWAVIFWIIYERGNEVLTVAQKKWRKRWKRHRKRLKRARERCARAKERERKLREKNKSK
ncbi:PREDICTED: mitochondrial uncoupling protein 4-like [Nicrophorus vespilloides]|uniref:Mitochondrial uncoupling protein 4-like n=1 Tax=Nicrophorus vespilloides TaxID=110193 RepID=A0ABM1MJ32_NICVS|nr:PREDICTED: mitochondrial uncoupling protein 4-like [Nicrophorus vespilloides]